MSCFDEQIQTEDSSDYQAYCLEQEYFDSLERDAALEELADELEKNRPAIWDEFYQELRDQERLVRCLVDSKNESRELEEV
jgi:hypothetical protein